MCRTAHAVLSVAICGTQMLVRVFMTFILMLENVFRLILQTLYNFISFMLQMMSLVPICLVFLLTTRLKCFMCGGGGPCPVNRGGACDCLMSAAAIVLLFFIFRAVGVLDKIFYRIGYVQAPPILVTRFVPTPGDVTNCSREDYRGTTTLPTTTMNYTTDNSTYTGTYEYTDFNTEAYTEAFTTAFPTTFPTTLPTILPTTFPTAFTTGANLRNNPEMYYFHDTETVVRDLASTKKKSTTTVATEKWNLFRAAHVDRPTHETTAAVRMINDDSGNDPSRTQQMNTANNVLAGLRELEYMDATSAIPVNTATPENAVSNKLAGHKTADSIQETIHTTVVNPTATTFEGLFATEVYFKDIEPDEKSKLLEVKTTLSRILHREVRSKAMTTTVKSTQNNPTLTTTIAQMTAIETETQTLKPRTGLKQTFESKFLKFTTVDAKKSTQALKDALENFTGGVVTTTSALFYLS